MRQSHGSALRAHSQQPEVSRTMQTHCRSAMLDSDTFCSRNSLLLYLQTFSKTDVNFKCNFNSTLQLVLDDSERIRSTLQDFRPVLDEVSTVCDVKIQEEKLNQNDQQVHKMQSKILEPLEQFLQAVEVRHLCLSDAMMDYLCAGKGC